jgi:hypothetical protein
MPAVSQVAQVPPAPAASAGLPASLSNEQFWAIISEFSENGGSFPSDNFTSNELQIGQVAADLIARGRTGGAYLGVGPEQNFTYIAAVRPEIVFIVDIRRQAVMQHLMYKAIFEMSNNRSEFIARLFSKPVQTPAAADTSIRDIWNLYAPVASDSALYRTNAEAIHTHLTRTRALPLSVPDSLTIAQVYSVFWRHGPAISYNARVGSAPSGNPAPANFLSLTLITDTSGVARSFLASEENYQFVRTLHSKNLFIPVVGNFGGPQALRKVGDFLRAHRTFLNGHYVSNVEQYLFRPPSGPGQPVWREYYTSIGFMPLDSLSVFIRPNSIRVNNARVLRLVQGFQPVPNTQLTYRVAAPPAPPTPPLVAVVEQQPFLGAVSGVVTDSSTGAPLANVAVQLLGTSAAAQTNGTGQYSIPNVAPGAYTMRAARLGYAAPIAADVRVVAGTPLTVDFRMTVVPIVYSAVTVRAASSASGASNGISLCPMLEFLGAFSAGRLSSYNDATRCAR